MLKSHYKYTRINRIHYENEFPLFLHGDYQKNVNYTCGSHLYLVLYFHQTVRIYTLCHLSSMYPPSYHFSTHNSSTHLSIHQPSIPLSFIHSLVLVLIDQSTNPSIYILIHPSICPSFFGFFLYLCIHNSSTHPYLHAYIIHSFTPFLSSHQSIHSSIC